MGLCFNWTGTHTQAFPPYQLVFISASDAVSTRRDLTLLERFHSWQLRALCLFDKVEPYASRSFQFQLLGAVLSGIARVWL